MITLKRLAQELLTETKIFSDLNVGSVGGGGGDDTGSCGGLVFHERFLHNF